MARPEISRRVRRWGALSGGLVFVVVVAVWLASQMTLPWAESALREKAAGAGVRLEPELTAVGLTGGVLARSRAEAPGVVAETGEVRAVWTVPEILSGRTETVEIDRVDATVDLARWFPMPAAGASTPTGPRPASSPRPPVPDTVKPTPLAPPVDLRRAPAPPAAPPVEPSPRLDPPPLPKPSASTKASAAAGRILPEAPFWARDLPFSHLLLGTSAIDFRFGEASLPVTTGLEFREAEGERRLDIRLNGAGFRSHASLLGDPASHTWSLTGQWQGTHPLALARDLFPVGHRLNPETYARRLVSAWRVGTVTVDALAEGTDRQLRRLSALVDHGPLRATRPSGDGFLMRKASAGITFEDDHWRKLEAVLEFDEAGFAGVAAEPFMVNFGWAEGEPGRVEVPALRLSRGQDLAARLAARGFLQKDGSAELQFAFSSLNYGRFTLAPFRWFLNARDQRVTSRMSSLSVPAWPDWQLARTEWVVENRPLWTPPTGPWRMTGSTQVEYAPEVRMLSKVSWEVVPRSAEVFDAKVQVVGEIGERLGDFLGAVTREGGFTLRGSGSWALADTMPYLFPFLPALKGLLGKGQLRWEVNAESDPVFAARASGKATFVDGGARFPKHNFEASGLNGTIGLSARGPFVASTGEQVLTVAEVRFGEEALTDLTIRFRWVHVHELQVLGIEGHWLGGQVAIDPFSFDPFDPKVRTTVRMTDIESKRLFPDPETTGFLVDARLSGTVPLTYSKAGGLVLMRGVLEALNPAKAVLRVSDSKAMSQFLPLPDTFKLKEKVLAAVRNDFRFRSIRIDLLNPDTPLEPVVIEFEGGVKTPEVEMESVHVKVPQRFDRELKGWEGLLMLFSGGTLGL